MKYLIPFIFLFVGCSNYVPKSDYVKLTDSIRVLKTEREQYIRDMGYNGVLRDSIAYLKQWVIMTKDQHDRLQKYDRLYKYYKICANNPTQWIYYKGWSIRVFKE